MAENIKNSVKKIEQIIENQIKRVDNMKMQEEFIDYKKLDRIIIGMCGGDGIGPIITNEAHRILAFILADEEAQGKVEFFDIEGLTIENRGKVGKAVPDDILEEIKKCNVLLKGPTTTPRSGDKWPNIESANVALRKALDLFANIRPVKVPADGIDWTFFRENTEGSYVLGSQGVAINDEISFDFTVTTSVGTERIARLAYEYARNNGKKRVSIVTKANVIKKTDGKFLSICKNISKEYPEIETDDWYIDIMTAKLIDEKRRRNFQVFVLPNLYGDILTDEAAEFQGGVGTAGSANIGKRYAMFEAIHGSAPRMVNEGREKYANPCSMFKAVVLMLSHIGYQTKADLLDKALDQCMFSEKKIIITGRDNGATCGEFTDYVMDVYEQKYKQFCPGDALVDTSPVGNI